MKRILALCLALCCVFSVPLVRAGAEDDAPAYTGVTRVACNIRAEMDKNSAAVGQIPAGKRFDMYWCEPTWAYVRYNGKTGYIRRSCIEHAEPVDPSTTPPYGVEVYAYTAVMAGDAPVMSQIGGGETLITLHEGARVALIGLENGWGKLVYHRQYAYIDSRCFASLLPTWRDAESAGPDAPIAAFVSFYKITTDEANLGRMENIRVACEKMSQIVFQSGEGLDFNKQIGPYNKNNGYFPAIVLVDGKSTLGYGGGTCQVSSTLYNTVLQLPGLTVTMRRAHGPSGASYLPHGVDAAVGNSKINFKFRNDYAFPVRIDASAQDGALYIAIYKVQE